MLLCERDELKDTRVIILEYLHKNIHSMLIGALIEAILSLKELAKNHAM
jgi:hypothetical protein